MTAAPGQRDEQRKAEYEPGTVREAIAVAERRASPSRPGGRQASYASVAAFALAAVGFVSVYEPPRELLKPPFGSVAQAATLPPAAASPNAFGRSGEVKVRFALPNESVEYPFEVRGDLRSLAYQWVRLGDTTSKEPARPLAGANVVAPEAPGFYRLALVRTTPSRDSVGSGVAERRLVEGITLAVLVPFSQKLGATLNGYRIGTYVAERLKGTSHDRPEGFVEVDADDVNLPLSKHLRLGDFVSRDNQTVWPRYAALNPRLLDKLELVLAEIASWRGDTANVRVALDVHSGFRTPLYNRTVKRSAKDSRHQYGDAADVTIDANGDGRYTIADSKLVVRAVEAVEAQHPDLAGGLGLYTSRRYSTPYVHIDARGTKARWKG